MKYLMIDSTGGGAEGSFHVFEDDGNGQQVLIYTGTLEDEAYFKILERAGISVEVYELDDFMKALTEGKFSGEMGDSLELRTCSSCGKKGTNNCPLRVWGRNEKQEGKNINTKATDYCSHFELEDEG